MVSDAEEVCVCVWVDGAWQKWDAQGGRPHQRGQILSKKDYLNWDVKDKTEPAKQRSGKSIQIRGNGK